MRNSQSRVVLSKVTEKETPNCMEESISLTGAEALTVFFDNFYLINISNCYISMSHLNLNIC